MSTVKTIFLSEIIIVFFMALGLLPQEFSYLILLLLGISFIKLNILDSLKLFILSIPFFTALPANALSDSMSVWRILVVVLFLKAGWEKIGWFHNPKQCANKCQTVQKLSLRAPMSIGEKSICEEMAETTDPSAPLGMTKTVFFEFSDSLKWRNKLWSALGFHSPMGLWS